MRKQSLYGVMSGCNTYLYNQERKVWSGNHLIFLQILCAFFFLGEEKMFNHIRLKGVVPCTPNISSFLKNIIGNSLDKCGASFSY